MANKKYTPKELERAVNAYFDSISYVVPVMTKVRVTQKDSEGQEIPVLDQYGHEKYKYEPVKLRNGECAEEIKWIRGPSVIDLALHLDVDRATLWRWKEKPGDKPADRKICNILVRAWGRIEAYLTAQTEDPKKARGAIENLKANFKWKQYTEVGYSEETLDAIKEGANMTMAQKLQELQAMGLQIPGLGSEKGEMKDDD